MNTRTLRGGQFYGDTCIRRTIPGFTVLETSYESGVKLPKHSHECACFSLMLRGAMAENYSTRALESEPQTVAFNAANEEHWNAISSKGARFLILELGPDLTKWTQHKSVMFRKSAVFRHGELPALGFRLYQEFLRDDDVSVFGMESVALEMIAMLYRMNGETRRRPPRWLVQARDLIGAQFTESLQVSEIATRVGVHPVHLARSFRNYYGCSVSDYVRKLRIELARHDLASSDLSLAEIAVKAGFCDQGHLCRLFRRFTGISPAKYRALFR
jgi:AraC family transcriptional regulator